MRFEGDHGETCKTAYTVHLKSLRETDELSMGKDHSIVSKSFAPMPFPADVIYILFYLYLACEYL